MDRYRQRKFGNILIEQDLQKQFKQHVPIVRTRMAKIFTVCVLGLNRCRELLSEHWDKHLPFPFELNAFITRGYLCV